MTRRASNLSAIEPEASVHVSAADINHLGLAPGDLVDVTTRRGTIELAVRQAASMPEGLIFIPFCFVEAPANMLTNPALDPVGKIPELKFSAAKIEKASSRALRS